MRQNMADAVAKGRMPKRWADGIKRAYIGGNVDVAVIMALRERCNETGQYTAEAMEEALKDWLAKPAARGGKRREGK